MIHTVTFARLRLLAGLGLAASFACGRQGKPISTTDAVASPDAGALADEMTGATAGAAGMRGRSGAGRGAPAAVSSVAGAAGAPRAAGASGGGAAGSNVRSEAGSGGNAASSSAGTSDGGSGTAADGGKSGMSGAAAPLQTGSLPAVTDPAAVGHFTVVETGNVGPNAGYTTIAPMELGEGGLKHPIVIWAPGSGAWPALYQTLLNHIASHGFVVVSYNSAPQGPELQTAMDWIVTESARDGSPYFNKLDTTKIAAAGQASGSLATFVIAKDPRLTTTIHISGGTYSPHTDVMNLVKPAMFICGDDPSVSGGDGTSVSDSARPNCDIDFQNATTTIWYGNVIGASRSTVIDNPVDNGKASDNPLLKQFLAATVGWLRWQLADDQSLKSLFVGPSCGFCTQTATWKVQQKNLD